MNTKVVNDKDKELIIKFLKKIPVFGNFSDQNLRMVMQDFKIISVDENEDIVFQADEGTDLFIVLKGRVKVSLTGKDGSEFVLTSFSAGDFFGEMSLIDGKSRSANVVAEAETYLGILKRDKFLKTVKKEPDIAFDLLTALVNRLRTADDMIETLAFLDVHDRLIKFLLRNCEGEEGRDEHGCYRSKKRTHVDLAQNIGSSREAVSKSLKVLAHKELVREKDGYFLIAPHLKAEFEI